MPGSEKIFKKKEIVMKKLLVLFMVLGMASMASAALTFDYPASATEGTSVTVVIGTDTNITTGMGDVVFAVSGGTNAASVDVATGPFSPSWSPWDTSNDPSIPYMTIATVGDGFTVTFSGLVNAAPIGPIDIGPVFEVSFDMPASSVDLSIDSGSIDNNYDITGDMGTILPEPMTIALLGLGGLGLFRRRRA